MEKEELCPKCKSDYLEPTDDPRKMICPFCGTSQLHLRKVGEAKPQLVNCHFVRRHGKVQLGAKLI